MPTVTMYSSPFCPYCFMAKRLLKKKGVEVDEIDVMADPRRKVEMKERASGRHTVPQIFIGDLHVGGNDDLQALERAGKLDDLLKGASAAA